MIYRIDKDNKPVPVSNPSFANTAANVPVGFMMMYAGTKVPEGFMPAQGQNLLRADYPELFKIIGTRFGAADNEHFSLPDTREVAIVGAGINDKSTADAYNEGQFKEHQFASHTHSQASHTHAATAHTHTMNHCHTISHCHGICTLTNCVISCRGATSTSCSCRATCCSVQCTVCSNACMSSNNVCLSNAVTVSVCSNTATNNAAGAASGGTHGKRMGIYYIIKVEADQ